MRLGRLRGLITGALLLSVLATPAVASADVRHEETSSDPTWVSGSATQMESDQLRAVLETGTIVEDGASIRIQDLHNSLDLVHAIEGTVAQGDKLFGLLTIADSDTGPVYQEARVSELSGVPVASRAARWVYCEGKVHDPHYSSGAGGAIFKVTVQCQRSDNSVNSETRVAVGGSLHFRKSVLYNWSLKASQVAYTQSVYSKTGGFGANKTYYVPKVGNGSGGRGNGQWRAQAHGRILSPFLSSTYGYGQKTVKKNI